MWGPKCDPQHCLSLQPLALSTVLVTSAWAPEHGWENPAPNEHAGKLRTPELLFFSSPLCWNHCFNAAANKSGKALDCSRMFYTQPLLADLPDTLSSQASGKLALLGLPLGCIYQPSQGSKPEAPFKTERHLATGRMGARTVRTQSWTEVSGSFLV